MQWLTDELKQKIRAVFEPRYQRALTDKEIARIADNLTSVMEAFFKLKFRQKYGDQYETTKS